MWEKISKVFFLHFLTTIFATFFTDLPRLLIDGDFAAAFGPLKQLLVNLLMLQSWFPIAYLNYNGVSWFLSTIMFLYLFNLPLCALLNKIKDSKHRNWIFGTIILLCTALTCGYSYITYSGNIHFMQYIFPPARLGQYIIGMVLGFWLRIAKDSFTSCKSKTVFFTIAEVAVLAFWIASLFLSNESWRNRLVDWIAPNVLLIGVFIMGQGLVSRLFCFKPLVRLGDVSFECYLIHQVVIFAFTRLSNVSPNSNAANLGCIFICLCFTVLLALFLNKAPKNHVPQTAKNASTKS